MGLRASSVHIRVTDHITTMQVGVFLSVFIVQIGLCGAFWDVETVQELDLKKYTGLWYSIYTSLLPQWTFQRDNICTTATYTLRDDGKIAVFNAGRTKTPTGPSDNV